MDTKKTVQAHEEVDMDRPQAQRALLRFALTHAMVDAVDAGLDHRGCSFVLNLSKDGQFATAERVPPPKVVEVKLYTPRDR